MDHYITPFFDIWKNIILQQRGPKMPAGYEKIKKSLGKSHPGWSAEKKKEVAAKIWNKSHKGTGKTVGAGRA